MNITANFLRWGGATMWTMAFACGVSHAATNVVSNIDDSGPGSLRQAILSANLTTNAPDFIHFNIAGAGPHTISPVTPLPVVTRPVFIDGYSQPGARMNTLALGNDAVLKIGVLGTIVLDTTNSTVRGLAIHGIDLGVAPNDMGDNRVEGNFIGLDTTGTNSLTSTRGVFVQTPSNRIGGATPGARNVISGQTTTGIEVFEAFASNNIVAGNYIGTDSTGTRAIGNGDRALVVNMNASSNTIGGAVAGAGNLISGNLNRGITLDGFNNLVQGNFIGTDVTGLQPLGNARSGVEISGPGNTVGGTDSGAGNVIAFNGIDGGGTFTTNGVDVAAAATGYQISGNSIFDNAGLGIDVKADKQATPGFPVLTLASNNAAGMVILGSNTPSITFRLELFSNLAPDPSGYGEGRTLLASTDVTTDGSGNFNLNWPVAVPPGVFLTATADGVTEFSPARMVVAAGGPNSWTNSDGGKWENATNWLLGVAPYVGHSFVLITNAVTKTVTNDTVTASGFPSTLTISNLTISAPADATNTLLLSHGETQTPLTIRSNLNINSGGALAIQNAGLFLDGPFNTGLRVDGSATLASGLLRVTNNGTRLIVGNNGRGSLSVSDGLLLANYAIVGANSGSDGTWSITGGSNVIAGGAFDIADSLTATGTVSVIGGRLEVPNAYVGLFGDGRLFISNGIVQCAGTALVGSQDGSRGAIVAAGGTSTFGGMQIRESALASGSVLVTGNAQVQVNGPLDNRGSVTVSGGDFNILGQVDSEAPGNSIWVTGGRFVATNGSAFLTSVTISNGTFLARDVFLGNQKAGSFTVAGGLVELPGSVNGFNVGVNGGTGIVWQTGGQLILTNTDLNVGGLFSPATGLLSISNGHAAALNIFVGGQGGGTGVVTMAGGTLAATNLFIGSSSSQNQLIASSGATLITAANSFLGRDTGANDNSVTVSSPGTQWLLSSNLYVGSGGASNRLVVRNGATVLAEGHGFIGGNISANANSAIVADPGTSWVLNSNLYVGSNGSLSRLVISNGAWVGNVLGTLGHSVSSSSNEVRVTGLGSVWSNRGDLYVGFNGRGNQLVVDSGGTVLNGLSEIGKSGSSNNLVLVTGPGSMWSNAAIMLIGRSGSGNQLMVTNSGLLFSSGVSFGIASSARSNVTVVTGAGSRWSNSGYFSLGEDSIGNALVVSNGGVVSSDTVTLGAGTPSANNAAVVTGPGSTLSVASDLSVGHQGPGNQLTVSGGGEVLVGLGLHLGRFSTSTNNRLEIISGSLRLTNASSLGGLHVQRGTNVLQAGSIDAYQVFVTNAQGFFEFNGGTLSVHHTRVNNGTIFRIGNGVSGATMVLAGNGVHDFTGTPAAEVSSNATLTGNGMIGGPLVVSSGGRLVPGTSIGKLVVSNSPVLQGAIIMEISRNGALLTNDQIQVLAPLNYGGSLIISNLSPTALVGGDNFKLFTAPSYAGSFSSLSLPQLPVGYGWTNKLVVDGSIEVIGPPRPHISNIVSSGTSLIISGTGGVTNGTYFVLTSTNVAAPLANWTPILTNQFNGSGNFRFTNVIDPEVVRRFYLLQMP